MSSPAVAIFAGGCFWCLQGPFDAEAGVTATEVGYTGGHISKPTYEEVSTGTTGHYEAIRVQYDADIVNYERLLDIFWRNIDPTQKDGQFNDVGSHYRTAIFVATEEEKQRAEASKQALEESGKFKLKIATVILPKTNFNPAEDYHEKYYLKNPTHYNAYKEGSGRGPFIKNNWEGK